MLTVKQATSTATDQAMDDYASLRLRLLAHQMLLAAVMASHPDKARLLACVEVALNQAQSQLLPSRLDDLAIAEFDKEVQMILKKSGLTAEGG